VLLGSSRHNVVSLAQKARRDFTSGQLEQIVTAAIHSEEGDG
jgi:hypothetical protein